MLYIDYGLSILSASVLSEQPNKIPLDLSDIYHELSTKGLLAGHEVYERFYEIGSHKGLEETIKQLELNTIGKDFLFTLKRKGFSDIRLA